MNPDYALEMRGITKKFPGVTALNHVSLQIKRGEIHCLLGENGAGKSTLMRILDGFYPAGTYEGEVIVNGASVQLRSPHDAKEKGIGFVPQDINVIEGLSVAENVFLGHLNEARGILVNLRRLFLRAAEFLNRHNINLNPRQPVSALTASQRQLVMIARALSGNPSVLILDEPTSSLTAHETGNLFRILRHLQQNGGTVIFITHKLAEIFELADRVTVLRDGAVVNHFARGKFNHDDIITAMVGRKMENLFPPRPSEIGTEELLRVESLTVPHPLLKNKNLVENVSFTVRRGEILGIAGLVGSGRSEVVNALYGRIPHSGRVWIEGKEIPTSNPRLAKDHGIGLVTEERKTEGLLFNLSIRENITLNNLKLVSKLQVLSSRREHECALDYIAKFGIRARSTSAPVLHLSGGNQQKVVLAKALFAQPKVLLLDEPTKGVDVGAKFEIYKLLLELIRKGIALVVISSELPELLGMCDRFIVLARGKITDSFAKADASEHRLIRAATGLHLSSALG